MRTLRLTLNRAAFEVMVTGEKDEEFRADSKWIRSRLLMRDSGVARIYNVVEFTNGYGKRRPRFTVQFIMTYESMNVERQYSNGLTVSSRDWLWTIKLGKVLSIQNHPPKG